MLIVADRFAVVFLVDIFIFLLILLYSQENINERLPMEFQLTQF